MAKDPYPAIAEKYEKQIRDAIYTVWDRLRKTETLAELELIIQNQGVAGIMQLLSNIDTELSAELMPVLESSILESGRSVIQILPSAAITGPLTFSLVLPSVSTYVQQYTTTRIRDISTETIEAVKMAVNEGIVTGRNPRQVARDFRSSLGLTRNQEATVQRFRRALQEGDSAYINSLSTPGERVKAAVNAEVKLSEAQIDKMVEETRLRYVAQRAETIARTESLTAVSVGQDLAVRTGQVTGGIANELLKKWLYAKDGRTRDVHISTGENNGWIPMDKAFVTPLGPLMYPRDPAGSASNVINCRCRVAYSLPEDIQVIQ